MKFSRTMAYAIHCLIELALSETDAPVSCHDIAEGKRLPERFLLHVLRKLVDHGVVRSVRGAAGGYCLNKVPDQITLLQIWEVFQKPASDPLGIEAMPSQVQALLQSRIKRSDEAARQELQKVTLEDLVNATPSFKHSSR